MLELFIRALNFWVLYLGNNSMDFSRKKSIQAIQETHYHLKHCLTAFDLVLLGVGAVIGAGIFVLTGIVAATEAGPAVILSYALAGIACAFAGLSYSELASLFRSGCGGAYNYAYVGFGEIWAWIIGWDLILEYGISVSAVAVGWSGYFHDLFLSVNLALPDELSKGPFSGGIINLFSVLIVFFLTFLLMLGTRSSASFNHVMVSIKLLVIGIFICIAIFHVQPANWHPFMPYGWKGVIDGTALIFFAYIGFDAIATAAEETIEPQKNLPKGLLGSLLICTLIYMIVSLLLTGILSYKLLNVSSPISYALYLLGYPFAAGLVSLGALAGLTTVMLVLFYGLSRVFFGDVFRWAFTRLFFQNPSKTKNTHSNHCTLRWTYCHFLWIYTHA